MNLSTALLLLIGLLVGLLGALAPARGTETLIIGLYGETTVVPCDDSIPAWDTLVLTTWRHVQEDGTVLVFTKHFPKSIHHPELAPTDSPDFHKSTHHPEMATTDSPDFHKSTHHPELTPTDSHHLDMSTPHPLGGGLVEVEADWAPTDTVHHRVSIDDRSGLVIERSALADRGVYTCVVYSRHNVRVHSSVNVEVYTTGQPEIVAKAERLEKGRAVALGTCVVRGAHPAAAVTWQRNGRPLTADGTRVAVVSTVTTDPRTGLSTTSSSLRYAATREDVGARFNCRSDHRLGPVESDETLTFPLLYPTDHAVVLPVLVGLLSFVAAALLVLVIVLMRRCCCATDEDNLPTV